MPRFQNFAAALIATVIAPFAHAGLIQVNMSGNITSSNMTAFALGQLVTVSFTYEADGAPQLVSNQQAFYVNHFTAVSIASGAYSASYSTGQFGQMDKYDNLGNTDGISFQFANPAETYQYTNPKPNIVPLSSVFSNNVTQTFGNFYINLASLSNSVWSNYALPTSYNLADFTAANNINMGFSGGSWSAGFSTLGAVAVENGGGAVPEPGTAILTLLAGGGLLALRRRS